MQQHFTRLCFVNYFLFSCIFFTIPSVSAQITGSVFRDFNGNGIQEANEPLVQGITINAYNAANTLCGTTTSAGSAVPNYSLTGCGTTSVRVEFVVPSTGSCANSGIDFSAMGGAVYGSSVQFVNGNSTNINFALHDPADYNTGSTGVNVYVPCYVNGDPLPASSTSGASVWFVGYPYTNSGGSTLKPSQMLDGSIIGATWGVAYSKQANKIFASALLKRHVGLGTLGSGGIYMLTPTATSFTANSFYNLDANGHRTRADATAPAYGQGSSYSIASNSIVTYLGSNDPLTGKPSGLGVIGTNTERGLSTNPMTPNYDPAAFDQVGKVGLGDIEISEDGKYLFVMNLYSRKVFRLELNNANNPTSVISVTSYNIPATACTNGEYRPFGLKFFRNKLYVGVVCSGENGGTISDLTASVYELTNPTASATFNTTALINVPLNYARDWGDSWEVWTNNSDVAGVSDQDYPTPLLSGIEFTDRGDMVMTFMDRSGHQWGYNNRKFLQSTTTSIALSSRGDVLIAGLNCTTGAFTLENNGSFTTTNGVTLTGSHTGTTVAVANANIQGPGGKEFFYDASNVGDPHQETVMGAAAVIKGLGEVFLPAYAISLESNDAGTMKLSTTNGDYVTNSAYVLYNGTYQGITGKANGLGDVELSANSSPIEIGNRVWNDTDKDGIQDANEVGIDGVTVLLFEGTTQVGTITTANGGQYYFTNSNVTGGLKINTNYEIRIALAQAPLSTLSPTSTDVSNNSSDLIDNDGITSGANVIKAFTTGSAGQNNHSYDFGFQDATCSGIVSAEVIITVVPSPSVAISIPPAAVCVGANITLTATTTIGAGTCNIQWQSSPNGTTWTDINGATGTTYNATNMSASTKYRARLVSCTGIGCCN
jgi:hypothetical protein